LEVLFVAPESQKNATTELGGGECHFCWPTQVQYFQDGHLLRVIRWSSAAVDNPIRPPVNQYQLCGGAYKPIATTT